MTRSDDFKIAFRGPGRSGNKHLMVHCGLSDQERDFPLVGFVIPKKVMRRATERNRTKRQLRHLMRDLVKEVPVNANLVVRVHTRPESKQFRWDKELSKSVGLAVQRCLAKTANQG